ncbi:putative transposase [Clostridium sp. DSM 8431]|nr:putative transposase [Clostridium sp. DSM 8431]
MDLDANNYSVFKLSYHLGLVIKYRRKVITEISKFINSYKSASSRLIKKNIQL